MSATGDTGLRSAARTELPHRRDPLGEPGEARRWAKALALVLGMHALPVLVAIYWLGPPIGAPPSEPAILVDMAPPAAPPEPPSELPPGPPQVRTEAPRPRPVEREVVETPPVPDPVVPDPVPRPEPPRVAMPEPVRETTAPPTRPAPPAPQSASGQANWQRLVLGHLDRHKRYPREAQFNRQQGVAWIRFVMDRDGNVLSSALEGSSGFRALDSEAVALPRRAQPLPKPPDDVPGQRIELVVPVEFFIKR